MNGGEDMEIRDIGTIEIRSDQDDNKDDAFERITTVISSGSVDGHGTYMTERTLKNFARALNDDSIQLKDSHKQTQGFGVSESGKYEDGKVTGTFKVLKGLSLSDSSYPSSDDFVKAVKSGLITKTSVGFSGGKWMCNICDEDALRSTSCNHWPKREYEVKVDGKREKKECVYGIDDSRLVETSLVSAGSNQDAVIIEKAQRCFELGTLPADIKSELETRGVRFEGEPIKPKNNGGSSVDTKDLEKQVEDLTKERDAALQKVEELTDLADCGKAARKHMAGEALADYKVSRGEKVTEKEIEKFEKRCEKKNFEELLEDRDYLRTLAPEDPKVDPGSKTSQPDNSGKKSDDADDKKVRGFNPPHWAKRQNAMEAR